MTKQEELSQLEVQITNEKFLAKAPEESIEKVHARIRKLRSELAVALIPCPNCGTPLREWQGSLWCPRYSALPVSQQFLTSNLACNQIWSKK